MLKELNISFWNTKCGLHIVGCEMKTYNLKGVAYHIKNGFNISNPTVHSIFFLNGTG